MGDDRKPDYEYEMAPTADAADPEKGEVRMSDEKKPDVGDNEWGGLNKEELLEVADTRFWNWTRNILLILFWVGWVAMLVAAIIIVVKVPRCPEVEWWEKSVFYNAFPRSFKDSDGDGIGDLKGLTSKLDYVKGIGAGVLVINSIFADNEPTSDLGQDIVDFQDVDSTLGTLDDLTALITAAGEKDLKVILEFVPNHSSDKHPWFLASRNRTGNFSDYYIWQDCGDGTALPNDWTNKYGSPAWSYDIARGQCYYHYLLPSQPDLNYDNQYVRQAMEDTLKFWFDKNVDGFLFSGVDNLFEHTLTGTVGRRRRQVNNTDTTTNGTNQAASTPEPTSEPTSEPTAEPTSEPSAAPERTPGAGAGDSPQYSCVGADCSNIQERLHDLLVSWRKVFNENSYLGKYRLFIAETMQSPDQAVMLYGNGSREADLVLNRGFAKSIDGSLSGESVQQAVSSWLDAKVDAFKSRWNTWSLGSSEISRVATRVGQKFASTLNFVLLTLPGSPISYYGEELGTPDLTLTQVVDPVADASGVDSRDPQRGPMYWANTTTGNFTNSTAWLPLPTNVMYSVEVQEGKENSMLSIYKKLAEFHIEPSMTAGKYDMVYTSSSIYAFRRQFPDWPGFLVIANFGSATVPVDFEVKIGEGPAIMEAEFLLSSTGWMPEKKHVKISDLELESGMAVLLELN